MKEAQLRIAEYLKSWVTNTANMAYLQQRYKVKELNDLGTKELVDLFHYAAHADIGMARDGKSNIDTVQLG